MKVQIIGLGTVGNAQAFLGSRLGHQMFGFDTHPVRSPYATPLERPERDVELTFICVPESAVEGVLQGLVRDQVKGLYVVKSTVPPGTTERLSRSLGVHICYNPEFLRQEYALEDVMRPGRVVIGQCCAGHGGILKRLYSPLGVPIHITDPATSELVKITTNALRAMAITFWNELHELSVGLGVRTDGVARMVDQAKALGEWEGGNWGVDFFGRPYGGACLPKDMDQLIGVFREQGFNPLLLEAVRKANAKLSGSGKSLAQGKWNPDKQPEVEISVVMPCLNEEQAIGHCVRKAQDVLARNGLRGEIIVSDNGSSDCSIEIARSFGARVVHQAERGYGNAYLKGLQEAQGKYIFMADSDGTYDFGDLPRFLEPLRNGYDFVIGSRLNGRMMPGAMPRLHRYIGVPLLTWLLNLISGARISDAHCGARAFSREAWNRMHVQTAGMEFASEMILSAARAKLKIAEVPIVYHARIGDSKLHSLRDGYRHIRFMLLYSPTLLFLLPGGILTTVGLFLFLSQLWGTFRVGGMQLDIHSMVLGSLMAFVGFQTVILGLFSKIYGEVEGFVPPDKTIARLRPYFNLERGLALGGLAFLAGLGLGAYVIYQWFAGGPGLNWATSLRPALGAMALAALGTQIFFSCFFLGLLTIRRRGSSTSKSVGT